MAICNPCALCDLQRSPGGLTRPRTPPWKVSSGGFGAIPRAESDGGDYSTWWACWRHFSGEGGPRGGPPRLETCN
eukprot:5497596-Alexandrium_andersonii.AAC.1